MEMKGRSIPRITEGQEGKVATEPGEYLHEKIKRETKNGDKNSLETREPIYMPPDRGVNPDYDIRTDKIELMMQSMDKAVISERSKGTVGSKEDKEAAEKAAQESGAKESASETKK